MTLQFIYQIDGYKLQAATVLVEDASGLIRHLTVLMRPWPVVTHVREAIRLALPATLPAAYWVLDPHSIEGRLADIIPAIAPSEPRKLASGVTFHSPMLAKSVSGEAKVATILREVHAIQGPLTSLARFVSPTQSVALWEANFSGYPMQGLQIDQLDTEGAILDQTVMLRPWPVVALFRDAAQKLPLPFLTPDYWILPEHPGGRADSSIVN